MGQMSHPIEGIYDLREPFGPFVPISSIDSQKCRGSPNVVLDQRHRLFHRVLNIDLISVA